MTDQAAGLRKLVAGAPRRASPKPAGTAAFVIGSGKGGVGKSVLSVLLATSLARQGRRVLLFDGSQNQGNLHVLLGVRPAAALEELLAGAVEPEQLLLAVADRLWLLPCDSGTEAMYALAPTDRARLHHRLTSLYDRFDAVVVDAGPGIDGVVRATIRATRLLMVAVPEPAALSDAYAVIKIVNLQVPSIPIDVLVNRAETEEEARATFDRLGLAARRFLRRDLTYRGAIPEDPSLQRLVRRPGELVAERSSAAADAVRSIALALADPIPTTPDAAGVPRHA